MHGACKPVVLGGDWTTRLGELVGRTGCASERGSGFAWACCGFSLLGPSRLSWARRMCDE